jgi:hypothetical protein
MAKSQFPTSKSKKKALSGFHSLLGWGLGACLGFGAWDLGFPPLAAVSR